MRILPPWPILLAAALACGCTLNDPNVDPLQGESATGTGFDGTYEGSTRLIGDPDPRCAAAGPITLVVKGGMLRLRHRHSHHGLNGPVGADGRFALRDASGERTITGTITGHTLIADETDSAGRMQQRAGISCAYTISATR